jgi:uncharacterized protein YdcH (DUF465 family)
MPMTVRTSLKELTASSLKKIFDSAQPVGKTVPHGGELGLRVNLQKDPQKGATLITTAEAICALAPHQAIEQQRFQHLINGLHYLWLEHRDSPEPDDQLNNRHIGWYVLAMIEANQGDYVREGVAELLAKAPAPGEAWPDAVNRQHEVYSTWIVTWALVLAVNYFQTREFDRLDDLVKLAKQGIEYLIGSLKDETSYGAPFTNTKGDRQHHESRPNPAMTAYILSLLPLALRTPSLNSSDELIASETISASYNTLAAWENRCIWDSYREPYQPGSKEGDFEHFTTCWVARAFWLALTSGLATDESMRQKCLWTAAKAIKGLLELRVQDEKYEGLVYVDRGSLRDYSFAVSDFLMLLNLIASERLPDAKLNPYPDDILERLTKTADIDILVDDVSAFSSLSEAYTSYEVIIKRFEDEAKKEASRVTSLKRQRTHLEEEVTSKASELKVLESQTELLNTAKQTYFTKFNDKFGTSFTFLLFDWVDALAIILAGALLALPRSPGISRLPYVLMFLLGVTSGLFCGGAVIYDALRRWSHYKNVLPLEFGLSIIIGVVDIVLFIRLYNGIVDLTSSELGVLDLMVGLVGLGLLVVVIFNIRRHKKKWDDLENEGIESNDGPK